MSAALVDRVVVGTRIDATSYAAATECVLAWARTSESRYLAVANVHMVMEGYDDPSFRALVNGADMVTPDGVPLVWALRLLGVRGQGRVYGPDLTLHVCDAAARAGIAVGFYGGTPEALAALVANYRKWFPQLNVAYAHSPPFRPLTPEEDAAVVKAIADSGARIVFIGLGCPKQERWMADHRGRVRAAMLGVGAAFDFHSGRVRQAPRWMMRCGLEWLFRLLAEPRRLSKRYFKHNPRFVWLLLLQWLRLRRFDQNPSHKSGQAAG